MHPKQKEEQRRVNLIGRLDNLVLSTPEFSQEEREEIMEDLYEVLELRNKIDTLEKIKVELDVKDNVLIPVQTVREWEERLDRLERLRVHYETKASAGATLRLAVEDLLTHGIWFSDNIEAQEEAEKINKYVRTVIKTRNYIIQKQPLGQYKSEDGFSTEEIEGQGLIINKRPLTIGGKDAETHFV